LIGSVNPENDSIEKVFFIELDTLEAAFETVFDTVFAALNATFLTVFAALTATFFAVVKELVRLPVALLAKFDLMFELILLDETIDYDKRLYLLS
jgi:hypothetical protein